MAIIKFNYTRIRSKIKASLRYITHRPDREGLRSTRKLFGWDGEISKDEAYRLIDEAERGTIGFRMILSPDPKSENKNNSLDLRDLTLQGMLKLKELKKHQAFEFIAVEHNDHTDLPHIHAIVLFKGKILKRDINTLRASLTLQAQRQGKLRRALGRNVGKRGYQPRVGRVGGSVTRRELPLDRAAYTCPDCGLNQPLLRVGATLRCPECGLKKEIALTASL